MRGTARHSGHLSFALLCVCVGSNLRFAAWQMPWSQAQVCEVAVSPVADERGWL
jgi:hypothetical protein